MKTQSEESKKKAKPQSSVAKKKQAKGESLLGKRELQSSSHKSTEEKERNRPIPPDEEGCFGMNLDNNDTVVCKLCFNLQKYEFRKRHLQNFHPTHSVYMTDIEVEQSFRLYKGPQIDDIKKYNQEVKKRDFKDKVKRVQDLESQVLNKKQAPLTKEYLTGNKYSSPKAKRKVTKSTATVGPEIQEHQPSKLTRSSLKNIDQSVVDSILRSPDRIELPKTQDRSKQTPKSKIGTSDEAVTSMQDSKKEELKGDLQPSQIQPRAKETSENIVIPAQIHTVAQDERQSTDISKEMVVSTDIRKIIEDSHESSVQIVESQAPHLLNQPVDPDVQMLEQPLIIHPSEEIKQQELASLANPALPDQHIVEPIISEQKQISKEADNQAAPLIERETSRQRKAQAKKFDSLLAKQTRSQTLGKKTKKTKLANKKNSKLAQSKSSLRKSVSQQEEMKDEEPPKKISWKKQRKPASKNNDKDYFGKKMPEYAKKTFERLGADNIPKPKMVRDGKELDYQSTKTQMVERETLRRYGKSPMKTPSRRDADSWDSDLHGEQDDYDNVSMDSRGHSDRSRSRRSHSHRRRRSYSYSSSSSDRHRRHRSHREKTKTVEVLYKIDENTYKSLIDSFRASHEEMVTTTNLKLLKQIHELKVNNIELNQTLESLRSVKDSLKNHESWANNDRDNFLSRRENAFMDVINGFQSILLQLLEKRYAGSKGLSVAREERQEFLQRFQLDRMDSALDKLSKLYIDDKDSIQAKNISTLKRLFEPLQKKLKKVVSKVPLYSDDEGFHDQFPVSNSEEEGNDADPESHKDYQESPFSYSRLSKSNQKSSPD